MSTSSGATAAPTDDPLSNSATARLRSALGNHAPTALVAAGQFADSPAPSRNRNVHRDRNPVASGDSMAASEYQATLSESALRTPSQSTTRPVINWPAA